MAGQKYNRFKAVRYDRDGFTLLEMLVIMSIIGAIAGIAAISITSSIEKVKFKNEIQDFIHVLKLAHQGASESTNRYLVSINIASGYYQMRTLPAMGLDVFIDRDKRDEYIDQKSDIITDGYFSDRCYIEYIIFDDGTDPAELGFDEAILYAGKHGWTNAIKMVFSDSDGNQYSLLTNRLNSEVTLADGDVYLPEPMFKEDVPF